MEKGALVAEEIMAPSKAAMRERVRPEDPVDSQVLSRDEDPYTRSRLVFNHSS
jgi:hypothetical protein